jgi:hypothetical protein
MSGENRHLYNGPGDQSPTVSFRNLPTVDVVRSTSALDLSAVNCVNVIGSFQVQIKVSSLSQNRWWLILSSGAGPVLLSLDNGALIAGEAVYRLAAGTVLNVRFDGANLVTS